MFHSRKPTMNSHESHTCVQGDSGLVLTTDPKPRLRWTVELHDRFVDAVDQLGVPDKGTPKTIMRVMGVKGLTLYHLKSHLQKFRVGKQLQKEFNNDHSFKDALDLQRNVASSSEMTGRTMNDRSSHISEAFRMQIEVQRRLHEQLEVQKHLQMRIEAQGKYMQGMLEKAYQQLAAEGMGPGSFTVAVGNHGMGDMCAMKGVGPSMSFPSLHDLHLYDAGEQLDHIQQQMDRPLDIFLQGHEGICLGKNPNNSNEKIPVMWSDIDLRLQDFGSAPATCMRYQEDPPKTHQLHNLAPTSVLIDSGIGIDSIAVRSR